MTENDIQRIEQTLGIRLPESYRAVMVPFAVSACAGNADTELWDAPDRLIAWNRALRDGRPGGMKTWPPHLFALGSDGNVCAYALDLRGSEGPVWWCEHFDPDAPGSGEVAPSFREWSERYLAGLRHDLEADGIDPNGTPGEREERLTAFTRISCLFVITVIFVAIVGAVWTVAASVWFG